jgi:ribosomal protein S18 acetylase RimI-like enzyme
VGSYGIAPESRVHRVTAPRIPLAVRVAKPEDGPAVARVRNAVVAERRFTAVDAPVTPESEVAYIASFGPRSVMFVAEADGEVRGLQTLEPFCAFLRSMDHVGVAGTLVVDEWRGRGVGKALWDATRRFAAEHGYEKVLIYVRAGNDRALRFYRGLGFRDVGVARRQVLIDGVYEDEVFLEWFLPPA